MKGAKIVSDPSPLTPSSPNKKIQETLEKELILPRLFSLPGKRRTLRLMNHLMPVCSPVASLGFAYIWGQEGDFLVLPLHLLLPFLQHPWIVSSCQFSMYLIPRSAHS